MFLVLCHMYRIFFDSSQNFASLPRKLLLFDHRKWDRDFERTLLQTNFFQLFQVLHVLDHVEAIPVPSSKKNYDKFNSLGPDKKSRLFDYSLFKFPQ